MNGTSSNEIAEGRKSCVSLLTSDARSDRKERVFISGSVLNEVVCHNKVKKKCMYDETVFFKD